MAFDDLYTNHEDKRPGSFGNNEKRTYYNDNCRFVYIKNRPTELRFLKEAHATTKEAYVKGFARKSRAGNQYEPGMSIPVVGHLPGFEGRCALTHFLPNVNASTQFVFPVFDFSWYHLQEKENERSISVDHVSCDARGPKANGNICTLCDADVERFLGGRKALKLSSSRKDALLRHDMHIMQFPLSDNPIEFFGKKVEMLSAECESCGHEVFSETQLQMKHDKTDIIRGAHECPSCGHRGKLKQILVAKNQSGERVTVERGDIFCKNVELQREKAARGTVLKFSSDLLPFESLESSLSRLDISDEAAEKALNKKFDMTLAASPYGIDPSGFKDFDQYVKIVTNRQIGTLNWLLKSGGDRFVNPFFGNAPAQPEGRSEQSSGFASRFRT